MTPLADILRAQITTDGPITVAHYMSACLLHPKHGYYTTQNPLGTEGDFITAPEISQMFGELIGLCLAQAWLDQGAPSSFVLAELGPGRGTLMADIWRATARVPGFHAAAQIALVEASPRLRQTQKQALAGCPVAWHDTLDTLPDGPLFLVANEFFDALPIRQFVRQGTGWSERMVTWSGEGFAFAQSHAQPRPELSHRLEDTKDGDLVETCASGRAMTETLGARIATQGGVALLIDYGDWRSQGDTLQAVANHAFANPLEEPGKADLTAHVDFEALVTDLPCDHTRLSTQGVFLERLGITQRAQALAQNLAGPALMAHVAAHRRLTHPDEMGTVFKTCALFPKGAPPPPGSEP